MKKFAILSLLLAVSFSTYAQEIRVEKTTKNETVTVDYKTQYKSSFFDNWYVQGAFGGAMLLGEDDSALSFGDRVKPGFSIALGKQITPVFGIRVSVDGNRLLGWNDNKGGRYPNHDIDPRKEYLNSKGVDTSNGYDQDIKYYSLNADFMIDLVNAFSKEKRAFKKWDVEAYVGLAAVSTIERKGIEDRTLFAGRGGVVTTYNISKRFGINFDLSGIITSATFDGHDNEETDFDGICAAKIGLKWRIGKQGFRTAHVISASQYAALSNYLAAVKTEQMEKGKPQEQIVVLPAEKDNVLVPYVVFYDGKDTFNQELQMVNISNMAKMLNENPAYKMDIVGNTHSTKEDIALSRANKVKDILISRYAIAADRLNVKTEDMGDDSQTVHFVNK